MIVSHSLADRMAMNGANALNIGLFGANCSSGRAVTMVEERWSGNWEDNLALALMADEAGIDFLLPIGRWKGYGGETDYQGATLETITWATGLLAQTKRITVFGTVHAPLFNPVIAAKQVVTADHVGRGRFGLNIVCGWNEGEFDMFGVRQRNHEGRYDHAQEWIDVIRRMWSDPDEIFDFKGDYLDMKGIRAKPKPYGGTRPIIMNAGASPAGHAFAIRNADAFFTNTGRTIEDAQKIVSEAKQAASGFGHELDVYSVGIVTCRPTRKEAEDYRHHSVVEHADWSAVDDILAMKGITPDQMSAEDFQATRLHRANGMGGVPMVGDPDMVAGMLADLARGGVRGIAVCFVNYLDELPFFRDEVLPRLERKGLRASRPVAAAADAD